ncbi:MAG: AMP-binding protein [Lachnospiraceae bacterium]|nr:AMP-binding protein [Lachnospiraceae bacterium]
MLNKILYNLKNYPDDLCYHIGEKDYTNKDLYIYTCNIYEYLKEHCNKQDKVIVYGHKDIYMKATFLACSFLGITYVPVDVSIPKMRRERIIEKTCPKLIIDASITAFIDNDSYTDITDIYMQDDDVYYIIFTSGSTGEPKGVQITYGNLKSCMNWLMDISNVHNDVILNQANFSFDLSVADFYLPLLTRSMHYIIEKDTQKDFSLLFKELHKSNASFAVMTPSYAELLLLDKSFNMDLMPQLKTILFCGEKLSKKTVTKLYEHFPDIVIINSYGPTECTFAVTSTVVTPDTDITLGLPKPDVDIYIVNDNLELMNDYETGEILIAGASVGKGYLDESLNAGAFIRFKDKPSYLTGDLAYKVNGKLYYAGRKDRQIKYKGYRIELREIESLLNGLDYICQSVVTVNTNKDGDINRIIAFVKLKDSINISSKEIKAYLENHLPSYMIPVIKIVDKIPLNENGKTDEKALLEGINYER